MLQDNMFSINDCMMTARKFLETLCPPPWGIVAGGVSRNFNEKQLEPMAKLITQTYQQRQTVYTLLPQEDQTVWHLVVHAPRGMRAANMSPPPSMSIAGREVTMIWTLSAPTSITEALMLSQKLATQAKGRAGVGEAIPLPGTIMFHAPGPMRLQRLPVSMMPTKNVAYRVADGKLVRGAAVSTKRHEPTQACILLGHASGDKQPIYWAPFETEQKLLNFGVLVTGDSGSGKTQTLRVLIDGVCSMQIPVCIFDFKNDYADKEFTAAQKLRVHDVRRYGIPFNPLSPSAADDGQAQPIEHIFTIAGVLKRVFGLGDRQAAMLRDAMKTAFERNGVNPQQWQPAETIRSPNFDDVIAVLKEQKENGDAIAISVIDRLAPLFELGLFPRSADLKTSFEQMLGERLVLSLYELPTDEIKAALAELIIIQMHGYLVRAAQPRKLTRLLVLDEAWRVASSRHLENLAREGRAFGVGLAIGTQYPGDLPADLAGSLATKIYLKNQQADHRKAVVRALTSGAASGPQATELMDFMERQKMFEGLIQNQQYAPYAAFKLKPYYER